MEIVECISSGEDEESCREIVKKDKKKERT